MKSVSQINIHARISIDTDDGGFEAQLGMMGEPMYFLPVLVEFLKDEPTFEHLKSAYKTVIIDPVVNEHLKEHCKKGVARFDYHLSKDLVLSTQDNSIQRPTEIGNIVHPASVKHPIRTGSVVSDSIVKLTSLGVSFAS